MVVGFAGERSGLAEEQNCTGWVSAKSNVGLVGFAEERSWHWFGWASPENNVVWRGCRGAKLVWLGDRTSWVGFTGGNAGLVGFALAGAHRRVRWAWLGLAEERGWFGARKPRLCFRLRAVCVRENSCPRGLGAGAVREGTGRRFACASPECRICQFCQVRIFGLEGCAFGAVVWERQRHEVGGASACSASRVLHRG